MKQPKQRQSISGERHPISLERGDSFLKQYPAWSFSLRDRELWPLEKCQNLIERLSAFEGLTWIEIMSASGGRRHGTNSHLNSIENMCKKGQQRLYEKRMADMQELFSLRLSGTERIIGILDGRVFRALWYDPLHEIFPVAK